MKKLSFLIGSVFDQQGINTFVQADNILDSYGMSNNGSVWWNEVRKNRITNEDDDGDCIEEKFQYPGVKFD